MPKIGEIKRGSDIGRSGKNKWEWAACVDCGKERWVQLRDGSIRNLRCKSCACTKYSGRLSGDKNGSWKGGRNIHGEGYIQVRMYQDDFYYPMAQGSRVLEHRLVMAKSLSRCLLPWEIVHHVNGVRDDNRLENLQLLNGQYNHIIDSITKSKIKRIEKRIRTLTEENKKLKEELKNVNRPIGN